ncbi:DUF6776 family protein [Pseudorhodoferax sp.]|uniref:DUF6776 family protein n=1 Tax=Pseudorhodoferax sp. TaxID=1993553 RepID=UPI002DD65D1B|nr:DUF6776 family protein [Pseudorhodoferax sp.]
MRWKLLRRRLSVSAPRVIVRSHLPWPLRWAVLALALGFSAALALWAFEFGKDIAGLDRDAQAELTQLRADTARLRSEYDRVQAIANTADSLLKAERATQEGLVQQVRQLEADKQALQADLGFFEGLLPATGLGLQLRGLQADITSLPGQLRYQLLLMQPGRNVAEFSGRYELLLGGMLDGRPWSRAVPGSDGLQMRQYARLEGSVDLPPGVVLKTVQARIYDKQGVLRANQIAKL